MIISILPFTTILAVLLSLTRPPHHHYLPHPHPHSHRPTHLPPSRPPLSLTRPHLGPPLRRSVEVAHDEDGVEDDEADHHYVEGGVRDNREQASSAAIEAVAATATPFGDLNTVEWMWDAVCNCS